MPSPESELKSQIATTLLRVLNKVQADSRSTREFGGGVALSMVEAQIVSLVANGYSSAADIAEELGVTQSAVSQVITKLKAKDLLTSEREADNARRKALQLTETGRVAAKRIHQYRGQMSKSLLAVPEPELETYLRFVTDLETFLDANRMR